MANEKLPDQGKDKAAIVETKAHEFVRKLGIEPRCFKLYTGMNEMNGRESHQEKYVSVRFNEQQVKKWGFLELLHITDVQFGHVCLSKTRVKEYNDWVLSEPNRFVVFGGDMIDAANIFSPGVPWENVFETQSQVFQFCQVYAPIAHRVLGYVGGNHERRGLKTFGDVGILLSKLLQLPYSSGQQFVDIHFGKWNAFKVDLWHGKGAAMTPGAKVNMLHNAMVASDANLVLVGHLHSAFSYFRWMKSRDANNLKVKFIKQGGAMSSSFLEYVGSYAEIMNMPMSDCLMACARIENNGHWELKLR